jgi:hypothetical protein
VTLAEEVADALVELGSVRAWVDSEDAEPERSTEAMRGLLDRIEARTLAAWRAHRATPCRDSARAVRRAIREWRDVWLYGLDVTERHEL